MLADQRANAACDDPLLRERAAAWLKKNGGTPELLVERGWHAVSVSLDSVIQVGFEVGPPDEHGHLEVFGPDELFETYSLHFALTAIVLSPDEVLAGPLG
jgi:hypothetical protein